MWLAKFAPFVAVFAVLIALMVTAVWHEDVDRPRAYESPCIVSWDEDGGSTLCVLTSKAAAMEHEQAE